MEYHFDGSEKLLIPILITQDIINTGYIVLPPNVIGVVDIYPLNSAIATNSIFNIRYQIALNDLYSLTNVDMVPYFMSMQHIQLLEELLVGRQPIRYN
jgi:hypothetical protein